MVVYWAYCDIKPLIENEEFSVDYIQNDDETLLKCLMKEKLNSNEYGLFETLLNEAGDIAFREEIKFLSNMNSMSEHFWVKR